jgi:ABC-type polysaccharide/polyol phosphate transport system ATPase subunit
VAWALKAEDLSKRFRRGQAPAPTLREELGRLPRQLRGRPGRTGRRGPLALDRVSLTVEEGESFAIIGANGAGKSTFLRIAARISPPTSGRLRLRGRVGALIEVGSGIHPELTGRENVWLYGSILGLTRQEIAARYDEIVAFSELEPSMETEVKYYSTGMQLRLGFAIAAHIDPAIFVVDEALAVGDAAFQAKCIERLTAMVGEGRTLIFISHSLPMVQALCPRAVLLNNGRVEAEGASADVVQHYVRRVLTEEQQRRPGGAGIDVVAFRIQGGSGGDDAGGDGVIATGDALTLALEFDATEAVRGAHLGFAITHGSLGGLVNLSMVSTGETVDIAPGRHVFTCDIASLPLLPGGYDVHFGASAADRPFHYAEPRVVGSLFVATGPPGRTGDLGLAHTSAYGPVYVPHVLRVTES